MPLNPRIQQLTRECIGFTPSFLNSDLCRFTGTIIIHQEWPQPPAELKRQGLPPANNMPANVWNGIAKLDEELGNLLQADITELSVSFNANPRVEHSYEFIITFYHE